MLQGLKAATACWCWPVVWPPGGNLIGISLWCSSLAVAVAVLQLGEAADLAAAA